jgi:hypothetical protein
MPKPRMRWSAPSGSSCEHAVGNTAAAGDAVDGTADTNGLDDAGAELLLGATLGGGWFAFFVQPLSSSPATARTAGTESRHRVDADMAAG